MSFKRLFLVPGLLVLLLSWEAAAQQKTMIFPQFANGGIFRSTIILQNSTGATITAMAEFFRPDGTPFTLNFTDGMSGASRSVQLGPNQTVFLETDGSGDLSAGWVCVTSSADIGGTVIFSQFDAGGNRVTEAGVGAATPGIELSLPVDARPGFGTGVALANFGADTASGTLRILDTTGAILASAPLPSLGARNQTARFVSELFPGTSITQGTLSVVSSTPLAAVALRTAPNILTTLPVTPGAAGAPVTPKLGGFRGTLLPGGSPFFLGTFMSGGNVFVNFEGTTLTTCAERNGLFARVPAFATGSQVSPTGEFSVVSRTPAGEEMNNITGRFISSTRAVGTARFAGFTGPTMPPFGQCDPGNYTFDVSFSPDYPQLTQFSATQMSSTVIQISYTGTATHGDVGSLILRFTDVDNRIVASLTGQLGTTATGRTSFSLTDSITFGGMGLPPSVTGVYAILVDSQGNRSAPLTAMFPATGSKIASDPSTVPIGGAEQLNLVTVDDGPELVK